MSVSLQIVRCFSAVSVSSSSSYQCGAAPVRISCSVQEALPSQIKPPLPPPTTHPDKRVSNTEADSSSRSVIKLPRQRYISVSKSGLLDAIISTMFPSPQEALQFLSLSQCLDSILHAEHKTILEEMRADFDATLSTKSNRFSPDGFPSLARKDVAIQESGAPLNNCKSDDKEQEDKADTEMLMSSDFTRDLKQLFDFSFKTAKRSPIKRSRVAIPGRFEHAFMKLLCNAEFEELSPRDLMLTSALNTDYLLTLPIYVDWKKASESNAIIFRPCLMNIGSETIGKFGVWLNEVFKSITQKQDTEVLDYKLMLWLKELSLSLKPQSYDQISDNLKGVDILSSDRPIWEAAQKAVTRYEGILSEVGPRERLLRKFLAWIGVVPSAPEQAFDFNLDCTGPESNLSPSFLSRISLGDIWKPASPKSCGNDFRKMLSTAISILFSQSILQEPSFQELILFYAEEIEERESTGQIEVPTLQMKIYERIPIPDLPVVFPHKKLSFRILDTVRLDVATILGLLAYFFSYKFEDILSSPSAILLDAIAASALVIYVTRVLLGYKQTRDRYQLLVNRTLHEKTVASGFGSIHFLLDASEQQQVEMPVDKAIDTLMRLGLVIKKVVDGQIILQAIPCSRACIILRDHWNSLIK
ncbi:hypothetical protein Sango_0693100 [Sesamum angolense]|uniref:Uncharacterized protein n=1 Tax=Sesamum angolense TaxID=2727404 RepID=A0AAE1X0Y5_9LAMI|nr:hypothetical protein Sango_0693100 [Sesamum angolense]